MKRFEYDVESAKELLDSDILEQDGKFKFGYMNSKETRARIARQLNKRGEEGWELVTVKFDGIYYLKREIDVS